MPQRDGYMRFFVGFGALVAVLALGTAIALLVSGGSGDWVVGVLYAILAVAFAAAAIRALRRLRRRG